MPCDGVCTASADPETCLDDSQCPSGQVCDVTPGVGIGCTPTIPPGGLDQPCGSHRSCQTGLHCVPATSGTPGYFCKGSAHLGDPCDNLPGTCDEGLACVTNDDRSATTCMTPAALGDSCQAYYQCGGTLLSSIGCDPATHTCVAVPSSGPCVAGRVEGCDPRTAYCDGTQSPAVCLPVVAIGAACPPGTLACGIFTGASCQADATGTAGTCVGSAAILCTP